MKANQKTSSLLVILAVALLAWNSVIARYVFVHKLIDPESFAMIRLAAGAFFLGALVIVTDRSRHIRELDLISTLQSAVALAVYMVGFALAHTQLDAGAGALLQFAIVQVVMFGCAIFLREEVPKSRIVGALIAFAGLIVMLWPTRQTSPEVMPLLAMSCAATGWALYSVQGRGVKFALAATGANFMLALPVSGFLIALLPNQIPIFLTDKGICLAMVSGAITSGLSYTFWYYVLPKTRTSVAGVAQLLIPAFAMLGAMVVLDETLTTRFTASFILVALGVAFSLGLIALRRQPHRTRTR